MNLTKFNLFLSLVIVLYIICASKYIDHRDSIFYSQFYKLGLLIAVLIVYPYHKRAGIAILIIALITHLPVFKEKFTNLMNSTLTPPPNRLENIESNYNVMENKRTNTTNKMNDLEKIREKKKERKLRMEMLVKQGHVSPLEKEMIEEIEIQFENDLLQLKSDDENLYKFTDEGDPINAGLLPKNINLDQTGLNYDSLIKSGQIIIF